MSVEVQSSTTPAFKDRSNGLFIYGIAQVALGCLAALMFPSRCWLPALCFLAICGVAEAQVIGPHAELKLVGDGFTFTEGPTTDEAGDVYFTDQPNDRIVRYDFATAETTTWLEPSGRSNGLYFVAPDRIIACADASNELWSIDLKTKQHQVLASGIDGRRFGGPNDCWVDRDGSIYFTDPLYKRPYWSQEFASDHPRGVYRLSPSGELSQVIDDLVQPNGIIGDAEKRSLFVADINARRTYKYRLTEDGSLADKTLFCESGSDGMTIDQQGNLYLTGGKGVTVFDSGGKVIETINVPRRWTANVTFAGPENRHLFITAGDAVFVIETNATGL